MASSLIAYGIYRLDHQSLGFRQDHLLTAGVALDHARYSGASQQLQFVHDLIPRLEQIPGVEDVAIASDLPASGGKEVSFRIHGEPTLPNGERNVLNIQATPDYFQVAGISLLRGRTFANADDGKAPHVVVVNQEFVQRYFQGHNALGKQIEIHNQNTMPVWSEVVGVVSNVKYHSEIARIDPEVYQPFLQQPAASFSIMLRTSVDPSSLIPELRQTISGFDPDLPLLHAMSMDGVIEVQHNGDPVFSRLLGTFAILALILASIGIYGLIAYSVAQRTHEIGIRLAVGATGSDISWMILREGLKIAAIGSSIGLIIAIPLPRLFSSMFDGFNFDSPNLFPVVLTATLMVAAFATWIPARRAARVNPTAALRNE
jgi:putative ABC transport system permease protein